MRKITYWLSNDSEENYRDYNSGRKNYGINEIVYEFNQEDFRSDGFDQHSDFPILFLGCSLTEGCGLPINEIWAYHLHNKICEMTSKKIPFWSLAKSGTGIDYAARNLYNFGFQLKPKYIFYLMSGVSRREFKLHSEDYRSWFPNYSHHFKKYQQFEMVTEIFSDPNYALYQTEKSLIILDLLGKVLNAKIFVFDLNNMDIVEDHQKNKLFLKFSNIEYFNNFLKNSVDKIPESIINRPKFARDNVHPGAVWHYNTFYNVWEALKSKLNFNIDKPE